MDTEKIRDGIMEKIRKERDRQERKWSIRHDDKEMTVDAWHEVLSDYNTWARRKALQGDIEEAAGIYIKLAALSAAVAESAVRSCNITLKDERDEKKEFRTGDRVYVTAADQPWKNYYAAFKRYSHLMDDMALVRCEDSGETVEVPVKYMVPADE